MKKCNKTQHGLTKETPRYFHHTDISISLNKKQCHTSYLLAGKVFDMMLWQIIGTLEENGDNEWSAKLIKQKMAACNIISIKADGD